MVEFRRKLYKRGSSFETTIPMPLLFALDTTKKHDVMFKYDAHQDRWYVDFEQSSAKGEKEGIAKKEKKR